jgi:hypothetical protein
MKKLMLSVACLGIFTAVTLPATVSADTVQTVHLAARMPSCDVKGYITPDKITVDQGELVTLKLKNEQPTKVDVVGLPGGNFTVIGNSTVEKAFTASESLKYSIWLETQDCMKAEARIDVNSKASTFLYWVAVFAALAGGGYFGARYVKKQLRHPRKQ